MLRQFRQEELQVLEEGVEIEGVAGVQLELFRGEVLAELDENGAGVIDQGHPVILA